MNKQQAYTKLFSLRDSGIDVSTQISELAKCTEVPNSVKEFITISESVNSEFLLKLTDKKFYKSITESTIITEQAKGLSSMITHIIIEMEQNPENKKAIVSAIDINKLIESLNDYIINDNESVIRDSVEYVKTLFKRGDK